MLLHRLCIFPIITFIFISFYFITASLSSSSSDDHHHLSSSSSHPIHRTRHARSSRNFGLRQIQFNVPSNVILGENATASESGPWSPWSAPSACSRSCGGGVRSQRRYCTDTDTFGRSSCTGPNVRYYSCNTNPCPEPIDFRAFQCSSFNNVQVPVAAGAGVKAWEPYISPHDRLDDLCQLYCKPVNGSWATRLMEKVIDGTKCLREIDWVSGICVDGKCMPVGCDGLLGSGLVEDKCRVCGGDSKDCNTVRDVFAENLPAGYQDVVLIPENATYIRIQELGPSRNFLSVRDKAGRYYLNGDWTFDITLTDFEAAGTRFEYGKRPPTSPTGAISESLYALGPLKKPLYIQMVYQEVTPGIEFEYSVDRTVPVPSIWAPPDVYQYMLGNYGPCSRTCGSGIQVRPVKCFQLKTGEFVDLEKCSRERLPELTRPCNQIDCPPTYFKGNWSQCICPGLKSRPVFCEEVRGNGQRLVLDESKCENEKPLAIAPCPSEECVQLDHIIGNASLADDKPYQWNVSNWSDCSGRCGQGNRTRQVTCHATASGEKVDDVLCEPSERPPDKGVCQSFPCKGGVDWVTTEWSNCSIECGPSIATRSVLCSDENGTIYEDSICDLDRKPETKKICDPYPKCSFTWFTSNWSPCSATCGQGYQTRFVFCGKYDDDQIAVNSEACAGQDKPLSERPCRAAQQCESALFFSEYGPCHCGSMERAALCIAVNNPFGGSLALEECSNLAESANGTSNKLTSLPCPADVNGISTPEQELSDIEPESLLSGNSTDGDCCSSEFGCCPDTKTPRKEDFSNCQIDQSDEIDDATNVTCSTTKYGCCWDGLKPAYGPFKLGCPVNCSKTIYGCCTDNKTPMTDESGLNCPPACLTSTYGCCADNMTQADENQSNCPKTNVEKLSTNDEVQGSGAGEICVGTTEGSGDGDGSTCGSTSTPVACSDDVDGLNGTSCASVTTEIQVACNSSEFGCCPDGVNSRKSENDDCTCSASKYGCCPDNKTLATGPNLQGCLCETHPFGCCQDRYTPATGPAYAGCNCSTMLYGCCPDGNTPATGPNQQGCGCHLTVFGCCPDNSTIAGGPNYSGCPCRTLPHGCCPDQKTPARGPNNEGCPCQTLTHGCCFDGVTPATGPNYAGCDCTKAPWNCCSDYVTVALGPNFEGCPGGPALEINRAPAACRLTKERGPCRNFTIKWYYDKTYGGCVRFWFGGCEGNANRFQSEEECEKICVNPDGYLRCNLPPIFGACGLNITKYYFNPETRVCETFQYSGCLGNKNNFNSRTECEAFCLHPETLDRCEQPASRGRCAQRITRYFYDKDTDSCRQFEWGGCGANQNNFASLQECHQKCGIVKKEDPSTLCYLPRAEGKCLGKYPRWYFDAITQECREFIYTGCDGNHNRFVSKDNCESMCNSTRRPMTDYPRPPSFTPNYTYTGMSPRAPPVDICQLPVSAGSLECADISVQWYYSDQYKACTPFDYRGCGGNGNRFSSREECEARCAIPSQGQTTLPRYPVTITPPSVISEPTTLTTARPVFDSRMDMCEMNPANNPPCPSGSNNGLEVRWFFDQNSQGCRPFYYPVCLGDVGYFRSATECKSRCAHKMGLDTRQFLPSQPVIPRESPVRSSYPYESPTVNNDFTIQSCILPRDEGYGRDSVTSWYYDPIDGVCKTFYYSGLGGNGNRFANRKECEMNCWQSQDICRLPPIRGRCAGNYPVYYYDSTARDCVRFTYGGCEGNANRFDSLEECRIRCRT